MEIYYLYKIYNKNRELWFDKVSKEEQTIKKKKVIFNVFISIQSFDNKKI